MGDGRDSEKDPDAFRTISEVAEDLNLPQHVLRFWETRFPQIKPVKRAGGRRFYRPEDVDLLRGIRQLLYREGYTIKGVQKILKEQGIRHVQDVGVERDVAVMRSNAAERPAPAGEGVILGGLLGLLPRRKTKGGDDPDLGDLPRDVELPLPFPDAEADRDLAADQGEPVAPLPPRRPVARDVEPPAQGHAHARRLEERRFDDSHYEERVYEERDYAPASRREPRFEPPPAPEADFEPEARAPAPPRPREAAPMPRRREEMEPAPSASAPSFAPPRAEPRTEPVLQRRPTRGPAARVSTAPVPDSDDPLLPFFGDAPHAATAEDPLEARIRRLKAQDAQVAGPPEEYLPPRLRRRPADAAEPAAPQRSAPAQQASGTGAWPELARAAAAAERDLAVWHEQIVPPPAAPSGPAPAYETGSDEDAYGSAAYDEEGYDEPGYDEDEQDQPAALEPLTDRDRYETSRRDDAFAGRAFAPREHNAPGKAQTFEAEEFAEDDFEEEDLEADALGDAASASGPGGTDGDWEDEPPPMPQWQGRAPARRAPEESVAAHGDWQQEEWAQEEWKEPVAPAKPAAAPSPMFAAGLQAGTWGDPAGGLAAPVSAPLSARLGMQLAGAVPVRPIRVASTVPAPAPAPEAVMPPAFVAAKPEPAARVPEEAYSAASARPVPPPPPRWAGAAPQRFGPFTGPVEEAGPEQGHPAGATTPYPADFGAGYPPSGDPGMLPGRPAGPQGAAYGPPPGYAPAYPLPPSYAVDPWGRPLQPEAMPVAAAPAQPMARPSAPPAHGAPTAPTPFWHGRDPFDPPQAPPIDPYLPPRLRTEPPAPSRAELRPAGPGAVQPVLSREDINRLQATLYELGECRRLLLDVSGRKAD